MNILKSSVVFIIIDMLGEIDQTYVISIPLYIGTSVDNPTWFLIAGAVASPAVLAIDGTVFDIFADSEFAGRPDPVVRSVRGHGSCH